MLRDFAEQQCQPLRDRIAVIEDENMTLRSHIEQYQIGAVRWTDQDVMDFAKHCDVSFTVVNDYRYVFEKWLEKPRNPDSL